MAHCFKNENIKTAKDYIDSKRYDNYFCNYCNKEIWDDTNSKSVFQNTNPSYKFNQKKNIANISEKNKILKANNHSNFLYLKKGIHRNLVKLNKNIYLKKSGLIKKAGDDEVNKLNDAATNEDKESARIKGEKNEEIRLKKTIDDNKLKVIHTSDKTNSYNYQKKDTYDIDNTQLFYDHRPDEIDYDPDNDPLNYYASSILEGKIITKNENNLLLKEKDLGSKKEKIIETCFKLH